MSAGTIALTNNSDVVNGTGTDLSAELAAGDFVVAVVGGITYTLAVKSVDNATKLTLASKYPGPSATGLAWNAVPRATQNLITAAVVAQATEALRGLNYDKQNWQQIFSNSGNITVRLPDGSTFSGPSWNKIASVIATIDIDQLQILATQIDQDAAQVAADKATVTAAAQQVATDKAAAANSASAASDSEGTATTKADEASDSAELSRQWAVNAEDVVVSGGEYSSYHWAQKAEKSAAEAASHNPNEALVKSLNLSDLEDRDEAWFNVRPTGATALAADPVSPYDATTKRWVENIVGAGTAGPTMNGVMNYGVGQSTLWLSRAYIPPYALPEDGQIVNRADWPELWAHAQQHGAIADSLWIADPTKRALYSTGDGSTTFRMRDLNGVKKNGVDGFTGPDSLSALYGRGDGGTVAGQAIAHGAPNVTGAVYIRSGRTDAGILASSILSTAGALTNGGTPATAQNAPNALNNNAATNASAISLNLGAGNPVYTAGEVRPNSFYGVWITRASGGFTAANTSWSVINGDATIPGAGVNVLGGAVKSEYKVGGAAHATATFSAEGTINGTYNAKISVTDPTGTVKDFYFQNDGGMNIAGSLFVGGVESRIKKTLHIMQPTKGEQVFVNFRKGDNSGSIGSVFNEADGNTVIMSSDYGSSPKYFQFLKAGNAICPGGWGTGSDERIKRNIERVPDALKAVYGWRGATWIQDFNGESFGIGLIAQDVEKVCPQAITVLPEVTKSTGEVIKDVRSIDAGQVASAYHTEAIRELVGLIELALDDPDEARKRLAALKE